MQWRDLIFSLAELYRRRAGRATPLRKSAAAFLLGEQCNFASHMVSLDLSFMFGSLTDTVSLHDSIALGEATLAALEAQATYGGLGTKRVAMERHMELVRKLGLKSRRGFVKAAKYVQIIENGGKIEFWSSVRAFEGWNLDGQHIDVVGREPERLGKALIEAFSRCK
jgi:CDI immunity protein